DCQVWDVGGTFLGYRFHGDNPCLRVSHCTVVKGGAAAWSASRSQCRMRVRGMRRRHEPRGQPHFILPPNLYMGPPVGGPFWFQIFIQAPSPEIWRKTIFGGEGGCWRGKWGGLFMGYLLGKSFRRRDRDHLVPPRRMDAAVCRAEACYPSDGCTGGIGQ